MSISAKVFSFFSVHWKIYWGEPFDTTNIQRKDPHSGVSYWTSRLTPSPKFIEGTFCPKFELKIWETEVRNDLLVRRERCHYCLKESIFQTSHRTIHVPHYCLHTHEFHLNSLKSYYVTSPNSINGMKLGEEANGTR